MFCSISSASTSRLPLLARWIAIALATALPVFAQTTPLAKDGTAFIGDVLNAQVTIADIPAGPDSFVFSQTGIPGTSSSAVLDQAVDRANRRLYVLTSSALKVYDITASSSPATLVYRDSIEVSGKVLALSADARTAFVGATGKVTAVNLYPEAVYNDGESKLVPAYMNIRAFAFEPARDVAAMGVHPAGDRLFVVIDMKASDKKLHINNDLLRSDVGNGERADQIALPGDFGFITQLDISSDVQTQGTAAAQPRFAPAVGIKDLIYPDAVAIGIRSLAFSPDGNYVLLSAVGASTPRATAFGVMPTSDEGTGGIVVLDVRPRSANQPWVEYLDIIPTTEKDEKTSELRNQIQREGWNIVHPDVQWARLQYLTAQGQLELGGSSAFTAMPALTGFTVAAIVLDELERSYVDYGYMQAYLTLYPRDMVGASGVAINHLGDFGVVTLQDTNNLGLLSIDLAQELEGYRRGHGPDFYIKVGTGKTVNGSGASYSWMYPQRASFTSDSSRLYIGMAGGTPKADLSNKFGSADALVLRTQRDLPDSLFKSGNPPPGYSLHGGPALKSPQRVATFHVGDADGDALSDQVEAFNRWNVLREIPNDDQGTKKAALISTAVNQVTNPAVALPPTTFPDDALDKSLYLPASGIGYRLDFQGLPKLSVNAGSRSAISTIERLGRKWHDEYLAGDVSRPYFVVGVLSMPGGGELRNAAGELLQYNSRNGFQVNFPHMSRASDAAHDFVLSNGPASPRDNSIENTIGFDADNMAQFLKLLLAESTVSRIELDPAVVAALKDKGINFADSRFETHGSLVHSDSRRDLDAEISVSFSPLILQAEPTPEPEAPQNEPGRVRYVVVLPPHLNRDTLTVRLPASPSGAAGAYIIRKEDGTLLVPGKEYSVADLIGADGKITLWADLLESGDQGFGVEILSPELDNVYSLHDTFRYVQWAADDGPARRLANCDQGSEQESDKNSLDLKAETVGFDDTVKYAVVKWVLAPGSAPTGPGGEPKLNPETGRVVAGKDSGTLYVEAFAANNPSLRTRHLAIEIGGCGDGCATGSCPHQGSIDMALVDGASFWVNDGDKGQLRVIRKQPGVDLASSAALEYPFHNAETRVVLDAGGAIRQVLARFVLMDVRSMGAGYAVDTYARPASPVFNEELGLFTVSGSPLSTLEVVPDPEAGDNGVRLTVRGLGPTEHYAFQYSPTENAWAFREHLDPATNKWLRQQSVAQSTEVVDGQTLVVRMSTMAGPDGEVVSKEVERFADLPAGRRLVSRVVDPDGARRTTSFQYNAQGLVESVTYPDGRWSRHRYDGQQRELTRIEPWLNGAIIAEESASKVTTFDYTPLVPAAEATPLPDAPRTTVVTILGQEVERTYRHHEPGLEQTIVATRPGAGWQDPTNLVTTTRLVRSGAFAGRPASMEFPDGTMEFREYRKESGGEVTIMKRGATNAGRTTIVDGTITTTRTNYQGQEIASATVDAKSGLTIDERLASDIDSAGRPRTWLYLDGTTSSTEYSCCGVESETDRSGITTRYTYDEFKRLITQTRLGITTRFQYDTFGRVRQTIREGTDGSAIVLSRTEYLDRTGDTVETYDALDRRTRVATVYNADGTTTQTTTLPGDVTQWQISTRDGRPLETGGTATAPMRYEYRMEKLGEIPCAVTRTIARVLDDTTGEYRETEWTESWTDMAGRTVRVYTADGAYAENFYNEKGQLERTVDPDGVTTLYAYNARGERYVSAVDIDRNGTIDYGGADRVSRTTTAYATKVWEGRTITVARTIAEIWPEEGKDAPLVISTQEQSVDGRHAWTSQFDAIAHQETLYPETRDGSWKVISTAPDLTSRVEEYRDGRAGVTAAFDRDGVQLSRVSYGYDPHGRSVSITDARLGTTTYSYYDDDQIHTLAAPQPELDGQFLVTTNTYNDRGLLERRQLPDLSETHYVYTERGQLRRVYGSQTYPIEYGYDSQGRMVTMTTWQDFAGDSGKAVTRWRYDAQRGLLAAKQDAESKEVRYTYTRAGRLETRTWARQVNGQPLVTTYNYHSDGALATVDYSDDTQDIAYSYHRHGQTREVRDGVLSGGAISDADLRYLHAFAFDAALRVETETIQTAGRYQLVRKYETAGATTVAGRYRGFTVSADGATDPIQSTSYGYDAAGRIRTVTSPAGTFTYAYRTDASLIESVTGPVHTTRLDYQPKGSGIIARMNKVGETIVSHFGYTLNSLGQRTAVVQTGAAFTRPSHFAYKYNEKGEVTQGDRFEGDDPTNPGLPILPESFAYTFDDIGNRKQATTLAEQGEPGTASSVYTANLLNQYHSLTTTVNAQARTQSFVHDADGNLTDDGHWYYTWNAENRLIAMETHEIAVALGAPKQRLEFAYDYQGRRTFKRVFAWTEGQWSVVSDLRFLYDGWNLAAEFKIDPQTSGLRLLASYTWGMDLSGTLQGAGGVGGLLAVAHVSDAEATTTYFPTYDANGNVSEYHDEAGAIAAHLEYGPFGETIRATGTFAAAVHFRFSTKRYDTETGLLYYGFRYFDSGTGRWISRDPIQERGGVNLYGAAENNFINLVDPFGLQTWGIPATPYQAQLLADQAKAEYYRNNARPSTAYLEDWSEAVTAIVEEFAFNNAQNFGGSFGVDIPFTVPPPTIAGVEFSGEVRFFKCLAAETREEMIGFEAGTQIKIYGGVGLPNIHIPKFPRQPPPGRRTQAQRTEWKEKFRGKDVPWLKRGRVGGDASLKLTSDEGGCPICPTKGWHFKLALGIEAQAQAGLRAKVETKLEWDLANKFNWKNIDKSAELDLSISFESPKAYLKLFGYGKGSYMNYF